MVTASRIAWVLDQLRQDRQIRMKLATHEDRVILHIVLLTRFDAAMRNNIAIFWLYSVLEGLIQFFAVDHRQDEFWRNVHQHCFASFAIQWLLFSGKLQAERFAAYHRPTGWGVQRSGASGYRRWGHTCAR